MRIYHSCAQLSYNIIQINIQPVFSKIWDWFSIRRILFQCFFFKIIHLLPKFSILSNGIIEHFLLRLETESSRCNTFSVGCRGRFRSDSFGLSVGWKVGPLPRLLVSCLHKIKHAALAEINENRNIWRDSRFLKRKLVYRSKYLGRDSSSNLYLLVNCNYNIDIRARHLKMSLNYFLKKSTVGNFDSWPLRERAREAPS